MRIVFFTLFSFGTIFFSFQSQAQIIENVAYTISGNKAYLTYDLLEANETQQLTVQVFNNLLGSGKPLCRVSGDVGKDVAPGAGKTIIYVLNEELNTTKDLEFWVTVTAKQFFRAAKR